MRLRPPIAGRPLLFVARAAVLAYLFAALLMSGCVDNIPDIAVARGDLRNAIARGSMTSPRPSTVALASVEGVPPALLARFDRIFAKEASDREISLVDPKTARYLVRGYLSASPSEKGADVAYVYDIFDADQHRIERVNDVLTVPGNAPDAWALLDDQTMASLAGRSADALAVVLARTPEAQAAGSAAHTATLSPAEKSAN